jgi:hypothetical protein
VRTLSGSAGSNHEEFHMASGYKVVSLTLVGSNPKAGEDFNLRVKLDKPVGSNLQVTVEKQRIVANDSGYAELRPTGANYFEKGPKPIEVKKGSNEGTSEAIRVKLTPLDSDGKPIELPDHLVFSAFIQEITLGFRSCLVFVLPPLK